MLLALRCWLEDVEDLGLDLCAYGRQEVAAWTVSGCNDRMWGDLGYPTLTFGPAIADWSLDWDLRVEESAGDFWEMVAGRPRIVDVPGGRFDEHRSPAMPGAWVDGD